MTVTSQKLKKQRLKLWLGYGLVALTLGLLLKMAYLWWVLLSPYGYQAPDNLAAIDMGQHQVFAYGTLRRAWVRWLVIGDHEPPQPAELPGYRRVELTVVPDADSAVEGVVLVVDQQQLARLDRYERLGIRYRRVNKQLSNGDSVWVYQRL